MTCCFFGHRDTPSQIESDLRKLLVYLIKEKGMDCFLVGNNGNFDRLASAVLADLQIQFSKIKCFVVLSKLPTQEKERYPLDTLYPDGLENTPPRFVIDKRNRWMLAQSDAVVGYISYSVGGAAHFFNLAKKRGKECYNLFEQL